MHTHFRPALIAACTLTLSLTAQTLPEACEQVGTVTIGQWAEYRATSPEMGGEPTTLRIAIVGRETVDGTDHYWHEMQMQAPQGRMIMQMLVPRYPFESGQIRGLIMKAGDQPAMRMPQRMVSMMMDRVGGGGSFAREAAANCEGAELVGRESVTTDAGTFQTMHLRSTQGDGTDIWVSLDVPFGIVRMRAPNGGTMELLGHGMDARSAITETPMTMPGG